ncbi:LysR family transcriptional regulator [Embleya sp. NBC_00896]|uniref:LysR family transcriptional regulator n=1 Tax=Embleya sp. NBC_00896 TaxID=2975961 RepID=UPI002F90F0CA|nr:LysR family transcriptional regulator [Embleya sp. NBC_00896]
MERYEIEAFLVLAEELHFGATAARLHLTTGRVSQIIQKLERRIGALLFDRTSRRVALTTIGLRFRDDLLPGHRQIQLALERAVMAARGFDGAFRVGYAGAAAGQFVLKVSRVFGERHPTSRIEICELQMNSSFSGLRDHSTEMVLNSRPVVEPDLVTGPTLWSEPRYLAVPIRHPLAAKGEVGLEDLADITLIRMPENGPPSITEDRVPSHTPSGRPIAHGPRAATFPEALALVGAEVGAFTAGAQVTRFYLRPDVAYIPFTDANPLEWGFIWRMSHETERIRAFNALAVDIARSPAA